MPKLINAVEMIAYRSKEIARLTCRLSVEQTTMSAEAVADIVHTIKVHQAVIKELQKQKQLA